MITRAQRTVCRLVAGLLGLWLGLGTAHAQSPMPSEGQSRALERRIKLPAAVLRGAGIETARAGPAVLRATIELPGEVELNGDRLSHIVPRVPGVVVQAFKTLGDSVKAGDLLALLESQDLAGAKSAYLAARARLDLATANYSREERLWKRKISAQKDFLEARQALEEARIELRSDEQKLHAMGCSSGTIESLPHEPADRLTLFEMRAPFDATVIDRRISQGEVLRSDSEAFLLADLSTLWVDLTVYPRHLAFIKPGQPVTILAQGASLTATGSITFIGPVVGEKTRAAQARVILANPDRTWRPGLFVTARIVRQETRVPVAIPESAIQILDGLPSVFVAQSDGFEPRPIQRGLSDDATVEVIRGVDSGEAVVVRNAFLLKAELTKGAADEGEDEKERESRSAAGGKEEREEEDEKARGPDGSSRAGHAKEPRKPERAQDSATSGKEEERH